MATDYYRMGADLGGAYFDGREEGRLRARREELDRQRAELHDMQMQGLKRQRGLEREQDDAFRAHTDLSSNGMVQAEGTGLSQPSAQFVASGNAGLGVGEQAVQDTASMYQREMSRFAGAANPPAQGLPKYDGTAPVSRRGATDVELEQSLGRISAAQRDARGMRESTAKVKDLKFDEGYKKYGEQLLSDMRDLGPKGFIDKHGAALNKNGSVDGFMTFDEKTGKIAVATKDGITMMDPMDVVTYNLGAYNLGNGNMEKGIALMTGASDRQQGRIDKSLERGRQLVMAQLKSWEGREKVKNDTARTNAYTRSVGAAEKRADASMPKEVPKEISDRMMAIELKVRDPNTPPEERARLREEFDMLRVRATYSIGKTTNLGRSGLDQKALSDVAAKLAADRGIPYAEAWDQVVAVHGGDDPTAALVTSLQGAEKERLAAEQQRRAGGGSGLRPPQQSLPPEQRPAARGVSNYGKLTPWPTIEAGIRAGDPAAIEYASQYLGGPYGGFGGTMPESTRELLQRTITQP